MSSGSSNVAVVKRGQIERLWRQRLPQAQGADTLGTVAGHDQIMRTGQHGAAIGPDGFAVFMANMPTQAHGVSGFRPWEFPGRAAHQPGVGSFGLRAVRQGLLEHTELIAHTVAKRWQA